MTMENFINYLALLILNIHENRKLNLHSIDFAFMPFFTATILYGVK